MKSKEFYEIFNQKMSNLDLFELKQVINNIIRKIPENKYEVVLECFNNKINYNGEELKNEEKNMKAYLKRLMKEIYIFMQLDMKNMENIIILMEEIGYGNSVMMIALEK